MSWKAFIAAFGCCLVAVAAVAQLLSPTFPRLGGSCSSGYSGVLDIVPGATACYSFRACDKALACGAAPAIVITQPDGTTPHTIHVTSSGILNQTELAPLVATVDTVFDQTKNVLGLDIKTQTGSTRPNEQWPCDVLAATTVCAETNVSGTASWKSSVNFTPATGVVSYAVMGRRNAGGTAFCPFIQENTQNQLDSNNAHADQWTLTTISGGFIIGSATDGSFHAAVGVINGASSIFNIDGTETTGTVNGNTVSSLIVGLTGAASNPCWEGEATFWDNVALSPAQRTALINNIRGYWGI